MLDGPFDGIQTLNLLPWTIQRINVQKEIIKYQLTNTLKKYIRIHVSSFHITF